MNPLPRKAQRLFLILGGFFIANALIAEFIGVKIFSLERSLGFEPLGLSFLGEEALSLNLTAGVILWPIVFVMSDIINEYYGRRGVRLLSFMAVGLILYSFLMVFVAMQLTPADFWILKDTPNGKLNMDHAFQSIFGQGLWIIAGSVTAFLIGQLLDVSVFYFFKRYTGNKLIWVRTTGSTLVSQLIDSFVVLFIAFYWGAGWKFTTVLAIGCINYVYKALMAVLLTPLIYFMHGVIDRYLGTELSERMIAAATAPEQSQGFHV
jgi:uncharacterized integral membrane protein (TIGR00697 family)